MNSLLYSFNNLSLKTSINIETMETNFPVAAKKLWKIMRVVYYMVRKGISKRKVMVDLNLMMKRGKIASKAISDLITFQHHHHHRNNSARQTHDRHLSFISPNEYEFSCESSPAFPFQLHKRRNNNNHGYSHFFPCAHPLIIEEDDGDELSANEEMLVLGVASPALPGFGRNLASLRQLRVTDSPFPLNNNVDDDDHQVDYAAEEFIAKFYSDLKKQQLLASPTPW